jgi:hypothetical protein
MLASCKIYEKNKFKFYPARCVHCGIKLCELVSAGENSLVHASIRGLGEVVLQKKK